MQNTTTGERKGFTSIEEAGAALAELIKQPKQISSTSGLEDDINNTETGEQI